MASERLFVLPGEAIDPAHIPSHKKNPLRLGPGLRHIPPSTLEPCVAGQVVTDWRKNSLWVEYNGGRYIPAQNDLVIGQIHRSATDVYYVSLTSYTPHATLGQLSFEGANKKTKPNLQPGALVYARVVLANRHMDPELECVSGTTGKADGLGPLVGGTVFTVSLGLARRLLMSKSREEGKVEVLELLGGSEGGGLTFETAVGRNGKVWVNSESARTVVLVGRALQETDEGNLTAEQQRKLVRRLVKEMK
ncbi:hypothetical protein GQ53DRAFT_694213 [Thozetella sp. PMI_491]|nr:hypothetical protein GQ53DRAFT_694213 [Thozetella sp. PMI_491]